MAPRRGSSLLPLLGLAVGTVGALLLLPSSLRPPPDQQQQSAALNPNAPPEDAPEQILQSLQQAASHTAGATGSRGAGPVTTTTVPVVARPSHGQCFGKPPRQTESIYSAPCRAAFVGDNGGATWKNVTRDEVRVGIWNTGVTEDEGPISDTPPAGESAAYRTERVLQAYFNKTYELYGRRLQLVNIKDDSDDDAGHKSTAVRADTRWHVFASSYLKPAYCSEMARRQLVTFCDNLTSDFYPQYDPYVWSLMPDLGKTDRLGAEYVCKKLLGRDAEHAGDPTGRLQRTERRIGLLVESDPVVSGHSSAAVRRALKEQCDYTPAATVDFAVSADSGATIASTMAQMEQAGVTTIFVSARGGSLIALMSAADAQRYYPEWFQPGQYALDWNSFAQLLPVTESAHLFGLGVHPMARPLADTDCYRAYRSVDPTQTPDRSTCLTFFDDLMSIANGLQEAGPDLTPDHFRDGLYSIGERLFEGEPGAMGGGYGPGDWTYIDSAAEIWFDTTATDPEQGRPGAWRWVRNGQRYVAGQIPSEPPQVFRDGITQPSEAH